MHIVAESRGTQTDLDFAIYWLCDLRKALSVSGLSFIMYRMGIKAVSHGIVTYKQRPQHCREAKLHLHPLKVSGPEN